MQIELMLHDVTQMSQEHFDMLSRGWHQLAQKIKNAPDYPVDLSACFEDIAELAVTAYKQDGELVGAMSLSPKFARDGCLYMHGTVVAPELQGRGISRAMFNYLHQHLREYSHIQCDINPKNTKSMVSRKKMGFEVIDGQELLLLEKAIDPEIAQYTTEFPRPKTVTLQSKESERDLIA